MNHEEIYLEVFANDNLAAPVGPVFYKHPGEGRRYSGSYPDLEDCEVAWNNRIRSVILHGPPGTTVWLYSAKGYGREDDVLEIKVQPGQTSSVVNNLDLDHRAGVNWIRRHNGIAGKVSAIQWRENIGCAFRGSSASPAFASKSTAVPVI